MCMQLESGTCDAYMHYNIIAEPKLWHLAMATGIHVDYAYFSFTNYIPHPQFSFVASDQFPLSIKGVLWNTSLVAYSYCCQYLRLYLLKNDMEKSFETISKTKIIQHTIMAFKVKKEAAIDLVFYKEILHKFYQQH